MARNRRGSGQASVSQDVAQVRAAMRERRQNSMRSSIPAYLVIGPVGMGKSALIQRSGFDCDPPVQLASSDWWLGESAFFIEVTTGSNQQDADHPVFSLLRSLRPAVPISGVITVVSAADLTLADLGERSDLSTAQTRFLRDFEAQFRYAPPLYFVVSKLDLTPGFAEFFDRLEPSEREQPWGFTLPVAVGRPPEIPRQVGRRGRRSAPAGPDGPEPPSGGVALAYKDGFRRLLDAVRARVPQWISQETSVTQNERIVGFGAQVAALEIILAPMIEALMPGDKRRWNGAFFRGIYLTSTQQDALSIDSLLPEMAKRFALSRTGTIPPDLERDDEALGYFVEGLFRRVILPEAGLVQRSTARSRTQTVRGWAAAVAVMLVCAALAAACALSFREGVARTRAINAAVGGVGSAFSRNADPSDLASVLTGLDALLVLRGPDTYATPLVVPLDSYAQALISGVGRKAYDSAVANSLSPLLNQRLARNLVRIDASSEALRAALAAANRKDDSGAYERWLQGEGSIGLAPATQTALSLHAAEALQLGLVPDLKPAYPAFARELLSVKDEAR